MMMRLLRWGDDILMYLQYGVSRVKACCSTNGRSVLYICVSSLIVTYYGDVCVRPSPLISVSDIDGEKNGCQDDTDTSGRG